MQVNNRFFFLILVILSLGCNTKQDCHLPHLGQHTVVNGDTLYYTIPKFIGLTNQDGEHMGFRQWEGKVFVAEFFFSQCKSICPIMTSQMARIQDVIVASGWQGKVGLLSHTIDPVYDQPSVLKQYATQHGADPAIWTFVNLDSAVYKLAQEGYGLSAFPSAEAEGGFFHTDQITLIDDHFHIRGYYDGTSTESMNELIEDLKCLMQEHH
jgi:protein SCO1/2